MLALVNRKKKIVSSASDPVEDVVSGWDAEDMDLVPLGQALRWCFFDLDSMHLNSEVISAS
jgi:hypothetical protein